MSIYEKAVQYFLKLGLLGHYDPSNFSLCLYDIKKADIEALKAEINRTITKCRIIVLSPEDDYTAFE